MTASIPRSATGSSRPAASGFQLISAGVRAARRTRRTTSAPPASRSRVRAVPIWPDAAETAIRMAVLPAELSLERAFFQAVLDGDEEPGGVRAVDEPVIVCQRQVHDRANRDHFAQVRIIDHDGPLIHRARSEDADLRLDYDRRVGKSAPATRVRERERATAEVVGADLATSGALRQVGDLAC